MQVVLHLSELAHVILALFISYAPDVIHALRTHRRCVRSLGRVRGKLRPVLAFRCVDQTCSKCSQTMALGSCGKVSHDK